jgi:hypothetical protein
LNRVGWSKIRKEAGGEEVVGKGDHLKTFQRELHGRASASGTIEVQETPKVVADGKWDAPCVSYMGVGKCSFFLVAHWRASLDVGSDKFDGEGGEADTIRVCGQ